MGNVGSVRARLGAAPFVGRREEAETLAEALRRHRIVTLRGPGGVGKTRLAVEVASSIGGEVCVAELAPVTDPAGVPGAVATALGLRPSGDPSSAVADRLALGPVLLVVDNAEHVAEALAGLLRSIGETHPDARVLVTSRRPLSVPGEEVVVLRPFGLPEQAAELDSSDAGLLFADRATRARATFSLVGDADDAMRILRATGGLPLAIELAAARVRHLSCAEIADGLERGVPLLRASDPGVPERHATLEAAVAWSWDLLSQREQDTLRRMGVFAGAVPAEAVRAVCGGDAETLFSLVDASLVVAEIESGDVTRYSLYESVRAFARERLDDAGEVDATSRAHIRWLVDESETVRPELELLADPDSLRRAGKLANEILASLPFVMGAGLSDDLAALVTATGEWWSDAGRLPEIAQAVHAAARTPGTLRLECLLARADGDADAARAAISEGANLATDARTKAVFDLELSDTEIRFGSAEEAERAAAAVLPIARDLGDEPLIRVALITHARAAVLCGMHEQAEGDVQEMLRTGDPGPWEQGAAHIILAETLSVKGDEQGSLHQFEEALPHMERSGYTSSALVVRLEIAERYALKSDPAAGRMLETVFEEASRHAVPSNAVTSAAALGRHHLRRGNLAAAREWSSRAVDLSRRCGPSWRSLALRVQSNVEEAGGHLAEAQAFAERAFEQIHGEIIEEVRCERRLGSVLATRGEYDRACDVLRATRKRTVELGWHDEVRLVALKLCAVLVDMGDASSARAVAEDLRGADGLEPDLPALRAALARADGDLDSARRFAADAIRWCVHREVNGALPGLLELQAAIDADSGSHRRAARLLGAAAAARSRFGMPLGPAARAHVTATTAVVRSALGPPAAGTLIDEGGRVDLFAAAAEALGEEAVVSAGAVFKREGRAWQVRFEGRDSRYPHALGFAHLARLLARPGHEIHVLEMGPEHVRGSDAGPVLDEESKRKFRAHIADLEREAAEADEWGDAERGGRARAEIERVTAELAGAVGLGGRDRRAASTSERARVAVRKAISKAIKRIDQDDPALARYLTTTIRTGTYCVYQPDERQPVTWELG